MNITLRAVEPADADSLFEMESDPLAGYASEHGAPLSQHLLRRYAENYDADPFRSGQLRLIIEKDGKPAGLFDLFDISARNLHAEVGLYILPSLRNQGIATQALQIGIEYCRKHLHLLNLLSKVSTDNASSLRLFKKVGFKEIGTLPSWHFSQGSFRDISLLILPLYN